MGSRRNLKYQLYHFKHVLVIKISNEIGLIIFLNSIIDVPNVRLSYVVCVDISPISLIAQLYALYLLGSYGSKHLWSQIFYYFSSTGSDFLHSLLNFNLKPLCCFCFKPYFLFYEFYYLVFKHLSLYCFALIYFYFF